MDHLLLRGYRASPSSACAASLAGRSGPARRARSGNRGFIAGLRPSCPFGPPRSTVPILNCGDPPSTAVIPLPLLLDLAPSSYVGVQGGGNQLAATRGLLPEHCRAGFELARLPLLAVARFGGFSGPRARERDSANLRRS